MGVLDANLRFKDVSNPRVADTSVMPTLNQGHTQVNPMLFYVKTLAQSCVTNMINMPAHAFDEHAAELLISAMRADVSDMTPENSDLGLIVKMKKVVVDAVAGSERNLSKYCFEGLYTSLENLR